MPDFTELREALAELPPPPWTSQYAYIWAPSERGDVFTIAQARGFGYYTGNGHGALGLTIEEAHRRQDRVAKFIIRARNDLPALLAHVDALEALLEMRTKDGWENAKRAEALEVRNAKLKAALIEALDLWEQELLCQHPVLDTEVKTAAFNEDFAPLWRLRALLTAPEKENADG
ncbi:MAG: hypothetical protein KIS96_11785 [Bauldia sp.]|nr:hypothetical protein [Bauldia sp.]